MTTSPPVPGAPPLSVQVTVEAGASTKPVHDLINALTHCPSGTSRLLAGWVYLGDEQDEYAADTPDELYCMLTHAFGRAAQHQRIEASWDPPVLTVALTAVDGRTARYELTPLSEAQTELAYRLAHIGLENAGLAALEFPDAVASVTYRVAPRDTLHDPDPDAYDPDDPLGFLQFAHELAEHGVGDWDPRDVAVLESLANDWNGTAQDLLTTAAQLGLPH